MNNCDCENKYIPGYHRVPHKRPCPPGQPNPAPLPNPGFAPSCAKPSKITLRTVVLPAQLGTDEAGEPYAPKLGVYFDAVVHYEANGATYIYDSNGMYTKIYPGNYDQLIEQVEGLGEALQALQEKERSDVDNLQENINQLANKEAEDIESLQTNINTEVNAREAADTELHQRIDDVVNSPDVRYIVETYADLEAIDKATIGDQDYARVLQDENHDEQSTYYQFNKTTEEWTYIGEVGPYYTKTQVDEKIESVNEAVEAVDTAKLNSLLDIKSLNDSLTLSEDGELSVAGGGSDVNILGAYTSAVSTDDVYSAAYINSQLNSDIVKLGTNIDVSNVTNATIYGAIAIGRRPTVRGSGCIALGTETYAGGNYNNANFCVALGYNSAAITGHRSVAVGSGSITTRADEVSFGSSTNSNGFATPTRYLANVTAGELDTDAVNMSQLNAALARISALEAKVASLEA